MASPNKSKEKLLLNQEKSQTKNVPEKANFLSFMGSLSSCSSSDASNSSINNVDSSQVKVSIPSVDGEMVKLNVYGLSEVNKVINYLGLGIYHSGVEVYGTEWAYGGYPKPIASIYRMKKPRDLTSLSDINGRFHFVETIEMGRTKFTLQEVKKILDNLGKTDWIGTNYHLLYKNCNSFSTELCKILCGQSIPPWINRVASVVSKFPFLINMLPEEFFTPVALQEKLKEEQVQKYQLLKAYSKIESGNVQLKSTETHLSEIKAIKSSQIDDVDILKSNISIKSVQVTKSSTLLEKSVKSAFLEEPQQKSLLDAGKCESKENIQSTTSLEASKESNITEEIKLSSPGTVFLDFPSEKTEGKSNYS